MRARNDNPHPDNPAVSPAGGAMTGTPSNGRHPPSPGHSSSAPVWTLLTLLSTAGCQQSTPPNPSLPVAAGSPGIATTAPGSALQRAASVPNAQVVKHDPCVWISRAAAEVALGRPLSTDPQRVLNAENPRQAPDGEACSYDLGSTDNAHQTVNVQVMPDDSGLLPTSFVGMGAVLDQIPDKPFTQEAADPAVAPSGSDPCALITRADAETVLGHLGADPFRSRKATALAYGSGGSRTYFTSRHRAAVITPTWSHAKVAFGMLGGAEQRVAGLTGANSNVGAAPRDKRDQVVTGPDGALHVLKGEKMLSLQYKTAHTSAATAMQFLDLAYTRS